jgi:hypothetical protein
MQMAWTQYGRAYEMRDAIEKGMREFVRHPEIYDDTYTEATKTREQWEAIESCVRGLASGQRHYVENDGVLLYSFDGSLEAWRDGWPENRKIEILVAMRFFEWYFHEQGRFHEVVGWDQRTCNSRDC